MKSEYLALQMLQIFLTGKGKVYIKYGTAILTLNF